ncbi:hypothetical protein JTE90_010798 [Oedothorax gibbosus]|uniref:Uncharacterized protein n=1 Tax=Oedothorax gibbosus TaxID=931172 RepID=A0AAV6VFB8_9ARAC|nr:hypothetical protein JTE90_010798 [Oedothorax gibbosus]
MNALYLLFLLASFFLDCVIGIDENSLILCANRKSILGVSSDTSKSREIVGGLNRSNAVDYHYAKGLVVWTDVETEKIYSIPIFANPRSATKQVLVESCVTPDGVAVDWIHDNLYWTDADTDVVAVARLVDGSLITTLVKKDLHDPRAIVIDPNVGLMFWTDWGRNPRIERAGMDGSQRRVIITSGIKWPNGLAIDLLARCIYWIDGSTRVLSSSNYDGEDEKVILTGTPLKHPFSLDILGDWLYWTDWSSGYEGLYKTNRKSGHEESRKIGSGEGWKTLMGVKVYDASKQPAGFNRCTNKNGGCTHLCLPAPGEVNYSCVCPDNIQGSENCSTTPLEPLLNSENERIWYESHTVTHVPDVGAIMLMALGIISILLVRKGSEYK